MPASTDIEAGFVGNMDGNHFIEDVGPVSSQSQPADFGQILTEMQNQNFDVIRFATYRTACKLRFLQKRTCLHLVDIWNMIEAFRENSLNSTEPRAEMTLSRLESLITSLFYQLNKRLPAGHQMDVQRATTVIITWLLAAYDIEESGNMRIFPVKIALSTMCSGKLMDKLRYIYSLISDPVGLITHSKFSDFIRDVLALPCSVFESPTFGFKESMATAIFDPQSRVTVNDFLDVLLSDPMPPCLTWLPLLHRLSNVETVLHPVQCDGCNRAQFRGFRYKCQRCYNYQLCQDCFWRGRVSGSHTNQHEMKEYTAYKSPSKQLGHSLKKSFRCVPEKPVPLIPKFPEEPEKTLNLSHIVPPSPIPSHNGFPHDILNHSFDLSSLDGRSLSKRSVRTLPRTPPTPPSNNNNNKKNYHNSGSATGQRTGSFESREDEHYLIARYATRLAGTHPSGRSPSELSLTFDTSRQRELISQLEAKNREIMREIMSLRKQQEQEDLALRSEQNPTLLAELRGLRQRKEELETHLSTLQESRRELMVQLESLMKLLKNHQASPRSTPNSSPRSATSKSPPLSTPYPLSSRSAPTTPGSHPPTTDSLMGLGGDVRMAFGGTGASGANAAAGMGGSTRSLLRNDLLEAADSVTNAMSSLVRELNSGSEDEAGDDSKIFSSRDFETEDTESAVESLEGGGTLWREERQRAQEARFMDEIQARHNNNNNNNASEQASVNGQSSGATASDSTPSTVVAVLPGNQVQECLPEDTVNNAQVSEPPFEDEDYPELYDNDPKDLDVFHRHASLTTDDESYVRTDDDEEEGTDWEETMRRWVNR